MGGIDHPQTKIDIITMISGAQSPPTNAQKGHLQLVAGEGSDSIAMLLELLGNFYGNFYGGWVVI